MTALSLSLSLSSFARASTRFPHLLVLLCLLVRLLVFFSLLWQAVANMDTNGCYVSIPVHYAGAALACACATTTVWRSKKLAMDAK